ncbi:hypothetical protein, partial [Roseibium sp.]
TFEVGGFGQVSGLVCIGCDLVEGVDQAGYLQARSHVSVARRIGSQGRHRSGALRQKKEAATNDNADGRSQGAHAQEGQDHILDLCRAREDLTLRAWVGEVREFAKVGVFSPARGGAGLDHEDAEHQRPGREQD